MKRFFLATLLPFLAHGAEDGKQNYNLYCAACHGQDGKGPENNPNPPLAKSEWLSGSADRAISAVLVGLKGPIEVSGSAYNLIMPPQGGVLSDDQLASILTYVRSSFENKQGAVKPEQVAKLRAEYEGRTEYFTANELRTKYPIPWGRGWPRLKNLKSTVYEGKWEFLPDFSELQPVQTEEEPENLIDILHAGDRDKEFGIVWEGDIFTSREGDYSAILNASDGAKLFVNGVEVVHVEGIGPRGSKRARRRRFRMSKGSNPFRLEYFNNQGNPGISLQFQGPTGAPFLSESRLAVKDSAPPMPLVPPKKGAVLYRNFIKGSTPKTIGVGYEGGVNQAFSIDHLGLDLIWQGDFIDAGRHWTNRGQGFQEPPTKEVTKLLKQNAFAVLPSRDAAWPKRGADQLKRRFGGYSLDEAGRPTFRYTIGGMKVTERSQFSDAGGIPTLVRSMTFSGEVPENLYMILANGPKVKAKGLSAFQLDEHVSLSVIDEGDTVFLRSQGEPQLVTPVKNGQIQLNYRWNK